VTSERLGNAEAYVNLGDMYYYGVPALVNILQNASLLQESVIRNHQSAALNTRHEATMFYAKAADMHHAKATFNLGLMHHIGDGVVRDFHLAKRYYDLAAEIDLLARTPLNQNL